VGVDGTGQRLVGQFEGYGSHVLSGVDWAPDGKWLLMTTDSFRTQLVEVSSGVVVPLTGLARPYYQASFVR